MSVKAPTAIILILFVSQPATPSQSEKPRFKQWVDWNNRVVVARNVNLRRDPSTDNPPIELLHASDTVIKLGPCRNGFCRVQTASDKIGWVWKKNIEEESSSSIAGNYFLDSPNSLAIPLKQFAGPSALGPYSSFSTVGPYSGFSALGPYSSFSTLGPYSSFSALGPYSGFSAVGPYSSFSALWPYYSGAQGQESDSSTLLTIQSILDSLPTGDLAFTHPEEMNLGDEKTVTVLISPRLTANLQTMRNRLKLLGGRITFDEVKLSSSMSCDLRGEHFKVIKNTHDEQLISEKELTEWSFVIIPQESGPQTLRLIVSVVIKLPDGREKVRDFPVKEETIRVRVTPFLRAAFFVRTEWHWILTTIIVPLGVWVWKRRREGRRIPAGFIDSKQKSNAANKTV